MSLKHYERVYLEGILRSYPKIDREIMRRKVELNIRAYDENGSIRSLGSTSSPTENQAVKYAEDLMLKRLESHKSAVERVLSSLPDTTENPQRKVIEAYYFVDTLSMREIAREHHISKSTAYRMRDKTLEALGQELHMIH